MKKERKQMNPEEGRPQKKADSITFRPDHDVLEMLLAALGGEEGKEDQRGLQSKFINDALRTALPAVVETWLEQQRQVHARISQQFAKHKKPNKS